MNGLNFPDSNKFYAPASPNKIPSALDPDPLDPQKYEDPRIRIQGAKYQPKIAKFFLLS